MISARTRPDGAVLLVAPVRGLASEWALLHAELDAFAPEVLGLGLSSDELSGLATYFVEAEGEPIVSLSANEASEVRGLVRFGEVRVPNPSFVGALEWARDHGVPVEPLDPSDERTASLFTEHIGYVELVRRTVRERRVARRPPQPSTPDAFALAWDEEVAGGRGSKEFARARDRHLVRALERVRGGGRRVAVVVDREWFEGVSELLDRGLPSTLEGG